MNQLKKFWASVKGYIASARKAVVGMTTKVVTKLMSIGAAVADSINAAKNTGVLAVTMGVATVHEKATALVAKINAWTGESLARFILVLPLVAALQLVQATMWLADKALLGMLALTVGEQLVIGATGFFIGVFAPVIPILVKITSLALIDFTTGAAAIAWVGSLIAVLLYGAGRIIQSGIERVRGMLDAVAFTIPADMASELANEVDTGSTEEVVMPMVDASQVTTATAATEAPVVVAMQAAQDAHRGANGNSRRDRKNKSRRAVLLRSMQEEYKQDHGGLGLEG